MRSYLLHKVLFQACLLRLGADIALGGNKKKTTRQWTGNHSRQELAKMHVDVVEILVHLHNVFVRGFVVAIFLHERRDANNVFHEVFANIGGHVWGGCRGMP